MATITGIELAGGSTPSGWWHGDDRGSTSVSDLFGGGNGDSGGTTEGRNG